MKKTQVLLAGIGGYGTNYLNEFLSEKTIPLNLPELQIPTQPIRPDLRS